ncbi:MAG: molybdenum cofactor guanylyltransferase [Firmicutes bacterium]|nr:molybdenum cofactor guanylyltransferase [Bacillota bacterium]MCL5039840.1 molybdenum cofactor guanylyltransferase [Bacillota bacterium]
MTGIVLAGGKSSRMKTNKALLSLGQRTIIEGVIETLRELFPEIILVTNTPEEYRFLGLPMVRDIYQGVGPLAGLHAGLQAASHAYSFAVACDMPFLNRSLIKFMREQRDNYAAVVPRIGELLEPMHAIYSKDCLGPIEAGLRSGQHKIISFYDLVPVRYIEQEEIARFGPVEETFFNVNTPEEYQLACQRRLWSGPPSNGPGA